MGDERSVEQQIQVEIERLRGQFPETQDLYREACLLLFFRFGITPTANKLYQFVRKGSMSAPAQALAKFWEDLRNKSRIRIEHPDLPEDLGTAAGELTAALWKKARAAAEETLATQRAQAQATAAAAHAAEVAAQGALHLARKELDAAQNEARLAMGETRSLEQRLSAEVASREATEARLTEAAQEIHRLQAVIEDARREFASELEKQRASVRLTEERSRAAEERSLVEIDRERTQAAKLQKELEQVRAAAAQQAEHHRSEVNSLQTSLGEVRQQLGVLEGSLRAAIASRDELVAEVTSVRASLTDAAGQRAALRVEADNWRRRADEAQTTIAEMQAKSARKQKGMSNEKATKLP
jgi:chromosome segregation ATPase